MHPCLLVVIRVKKPDSPRFHHGTRRAPAGLRMHGLNRELAGRVVVSIEQAVAAPYCSLLLADAGARVIKVERPEGDFARGYDKGADGASVIFAWLNSGKARKSPSRRPPFPIGNHARDFRPAMPCAGGGKRG